MVGAMQLGIRPQQVSVRSGSVPLPYRPAQIGAQQVVPATTNGLDIGSLLTDFMPLIMIMMVMMMLRPMMSGMAGGMA